MHISHLLLLICAVCIFVLLVRWVVNIFILVSAAEIFQASLRLRSIPAGRNNIDIDNLYSNEQEMRFELIRTTSTYLAL